MEGSKLEKVEKERLLARYGYHNLFADKPVEEIREMVSSGAIGDRIGAVTLLGVVQNFYAKFIVEEFYESENWIEKRKIKSAVAKDGGVLISKNLIKQLDAIVDFVMNAENDHYKVWCDERGLSEGDDHQQAYCYARNLRRLLEWSTFDAKCAEEE